MPSRRSTSASASPSGAGSRASSEPPDQRDLAAEAADGLRHLDPHRPAAQDEQPARYRLHAGRLAVGPDAVELAQPRIGGMNGSAPLASTTLSALWRSPSTSTTPDAGQPAGAAEQVDPVARQPLLLPGVGVVGDHEVAPRERRLDVDLRGRRARRAPPARPRPAAAASSTGCRRSTSTRHPRARARRSPPAARRRPTRPRMLTRRAAAEHDHVVVVAHVPSLPLVNPVEIAPVDPRGQDQGVTRARPGVAREQAADNPSTTSTEAPHDQHATNGNDGHAGSPPPPPQRSSRSSRSRSPTSTARRPST